MIKKTTFLKTLLVAAGLLVGQSVLAAGYTRTLTDALEIAGYKAKTFYNFQNNTPEVLPTSGDLRYRDGNVWGLHNFGSGTRSATVSIPVSEGDILVIQEYSSSYVTTINKGTENAALTASTGYRVFDITTTSDDITFTTPRYSGIVAALVMEKDNEAATADYTINYKNGGTTVKTVSGNVAVGTVIPVLSSFFEADVKYITLAEQATSLTVEAGGSTLDINVREAEIWTCTLNSSLGGKITDISGFEGESVAIPYPRYSLQGTTLYEADVTNKEYRKTVTLDANNKVETVTYTATSMTNVIFYSEGEAISGITEVTFGNVAVRASNALAAKTDADVDITTLPAGKYIFTVGAFTSKSGDYDGFAVKIGIGAEVFSADVSYANLNVLTSEEYAVTDGTAIKFLAEGCGDNSALDYIIIQQTAASVAIKTTGTTFSSAYAVDCANLPSGVKAYKVSTVAGGKATAEEVTEAVKAETGLILVATAAGNYNIPVAASGSDISATNLLKAAVTEKTVAANEAYGLSEGKFYLLEAGTIPAGKAYLQASDITAAPELSIVFGGEATGIDTVKGEGFTVNGYYNLNGQRVAQPTKGLYIVNGHKVVIK